ncbi:DUF2256 domain-containing protein [Halomonas sp. 22501_18_FS]
MKPRYGPTPRAVQRRQAGVCWNMGHKPLPEKTCPVCRRPFKWRRKWARCWDQVIYCSERCRRHRRHPQEVLR